MVETRVKCPLVDRYIEDVDCMETANVAAGIIKDRNLADEFKKKNNWRNICKNCKYHNY
jgi:hypothetical protein